MPVSIVFENLESGASIDEISEWFHLTREQIVSVIEFAARSLDTPPTMQHPPVPVADAHPLDQSTPAPLRGHLKGHRVVEARDRGWDTLLNGDLLNAAEAAGFEVLVTADKNLRYQQNLAARKFAIVVIGNAQWRVLRHCVERVIAAVDVATPGSLTEIAIPYRAQ